MQNDLLHALASVDWAETQLPDFKKRLDGWLKENIYTTVAEQPADVPNNVVVARQRNPLPLNFQVESGVYLNAVRSSLDILASTLASRHCPSLVDDAYFPVAHSADNFARGNYKGSKFVRALPVRERTFIETLNPYQGGNDRLYALHQLDIVRKHARLLGVEVRPYHYMVSGWGDAAKAFTPVANGWMPTGDDEAVIGLLAKSIKETPRIRLSMHVCLSETAYLARGEIVSVISKFANLAKAIIQVFDLP